MMFDLSLGHLGMASILLAFALTIYAMGSGIVGALKQDASLQTSARFAAFAVFLATTTAVVVMLVALLTDDFSVQYVAETSSRASPTWIKVATLWAALDGSLLLWAWMQTGYTALLALVALNSALRPWALVVMQGVQLFFLAVVAFVVTPFQVLPIPPLDGPGPNPLLQNHWMMALHPILMYLGFVGLTVPFAYAMAALITRRPGTEWMQPVRLWTLAGWGFLALGKITGGWWSYEVLGWGGYWSWDPVENLSFVPWLTATAFLHSAQVQERRRMLKAWNILLVTLTFALTILSTFLIRSGVLSSVHAFAEGPVGPWFFGFFILVMLFSFGLLALRWDQVRDRSEFDSAVSREGAILSGNVLFLAMGFVVLLGTLFPLIVEAVSGQLVTVGAPFFDRVTVPIWLLIFILMGIGPLLPWRRAEGQTLARNLAWMVGGALVAGVLAYTLGIRRTYPLLTVAIAAYNLVSLGLLISGVVRPRVRQGLGHAASIFTRYAYENRRRFGSMVVHFSVVVMALGVAGSSGYRVDQQLNFPIGERVTFGQYELLVTGLFEERRPYKVSRGATVEVFHDDQFVTTLTPRINLFGNSPQPVSTPSVRYTFWSDLYLNLAASVDPHDPAQQSVIIRVVQSPLIAWIWIGAVILALGTGYALLPNPRREPMAVRERVTT